MSLDYLGLKEYKNLYRNKPVAELVEFIIKREEGVLADKGSVVINTGKYSGRSAKDRFIVKDDITRDNVHWSDVNVPIETEVFDKLYKDVINYLKDKDLFMFDGFAGALKEHSLPIRVISEFAYQVMFSNQMLIRPSQEELNEFVPGFNVIAAPGFKAKGQEDGVRTEAFILVNFTKKVILIGGSGYCGEIKKAIFSVMNYLLPQKGIMPMHCSANIGEDGHSAVFFGLSGTGKTTLSTDPDRKLIGDDEHGWSDDGIFNFEGGCYAKTIDLDPAKEIDIYNAIRFGTVLENVVLDEDRIPDYFDGSNTENTRAAYPIDHIENAVAEGVGGVPNTIIFLTFDAFGVMPPVSKLNREEAIYHFMSGYTSKVAGTEVGIVEPQTTFSACFGEPFMLLNPLVYANLLGEKIEKDHIDVYLINTGYIKGAYGEGERISLAYTRAIVDAAVSGQLKEIPCYKDDVFGFYIPEECPGVPSDILNPRNTWKDKDKYDREAQKLKDRIEENHKRYNK